MAAPATAPAFLELVRRSQLVDPARLDAFLRDHPGIEADAPALLAKALFDAGLLTQFQIEQLILGRYKGFAIGKYKVLERIGFGGMGQVFLAEHKVMRRRVALKVLPFAHAEDASARERFYREARAAGALAHPNLVRAYDVDSEGRTHFLVLEYVDGSSLQEIVARHGPMDPTRAGHYLWQAALGLQHAHEAGLIHRDIKPANILVDRQGVVRILDLGLARFFAEADDGLTSNGQGMTTVLGTADYLAPEQARNSHDVDIRADIYGLGATAYFLLTGKPMFDVPTVAQKLVCHQMQEPEPLRNTRPEVPEDLAAVVARMIDKEPAARYQSPAEVAAALARYGEAAVPPPDAKEMPKLAGALAQTGPASVVASASGVLRATARATLSSSPSSRLLNAAELSGRGLAKPGADTMANRTGDTAVRRVDRPAPLPRGRPGRYVLLGACVATLAAGGGLIAWTFFAPPPPPQQVAVVVPESGPARADNAKSSAKKSDTRPKTPAVKPPDRADGKALTLAVGPGGTHATLRAALDAARPGDRIELRGPVAETATIDGGRGRGVTVEGVGPEPVVWTAPPSADPKQPLLTADGSDGLSIRNVRFDGGDRAQVLIRATGRCAGMTFERVEFVGFRQAAVRLVNCGGEPDRPVAFQRVRAVAPKDAPNAFQLSADAGRTTGYVAIRDSRFEGAAKAAVRTGGAVAGVEFSGNRVWKAAAGLRFDDAAPLDVAVRQNTFSEVQVPLHFARTPAEVSTALVQRNLFAKCKEIVRFDGLTTAPASSTTAWVWFGDDYDDKGYPSDDRYFRRAFELSDAPAAATLDVMGDDNARVWVNGQFVAKADYHFTSRRVDAYDVSKLLKAGRNVIAVQGTNGKGANPGGNNAAGLMVRLTSGTASPLELVTTGAEWKGAKSAPAGWESPDFDDSAWAAVRVQKRYDEMLSTYHWDSTVKPQVGDLVARVFRDSSGNLSDRNATLAFDPPQVTHLVSHVVLPADVDDDATFLRYGADDALVKKHKSPGAGPARKK